MSWAEIVEKASSGIVTWVVVTVGGGFLWVGRVIFTNQRKLTLLENDMKAREAMRERDRDDLSEVKADIKELREDVKALIRKG